jgi:predicted dithiol-disulfide oxidoreductase (DUF899 family)
MNYETMSTPEIAALEKDIMEKSEQLAALRRAIPPQPVTDATFKTVAGDVTLASLFGDHRELILIHNMGRGCAYCTLWADGFNGVYPYLASRAAFVVSSPTKPEDQQSFATMRGWRFPMVSIDGSRFAHDHGFATDKPDGTYWAPGVTVFKKEWDGKIYRVAQSSFGPMDLFCSVWHLFAMLPGGAGQWHPNFNK